MAMQQKMSLLMSKKPHVLVVDDDARLRELLQRYLSGQGFIVITAIDAIDAIEKLKRFLFDIAILDVMMPGEDGISLAKKVHKSWPLLPIVLLTALGEAKKRIEGLETGADDYISKPFEPKELLLRLNAILRRTMKPDIKTKQNNILLGQYIYDYERKELKEISTDKLILLTQVEQHLLTCLADKAGQVVTREELAIGGGISTSDRAIDVQVTRLRRKIEKDSKNPRYLHTIRGQGYILRPDKN